MSARFPKKAITHRLGKVLIKAEGILARLTLAAMMIVLGPRLTALYFSYSPLLRQTGARLSWLRTRINDRHGRRAAVEATLIYLSARPRPQHYYPALVQSHAAYPTHEEVAAAIPRLIEGTRQQPAAVMALVSSLLERGDSALAANVVIKKVCQPRGQRWDPRYDAIRLKPLNASNEQGGCHAFLPDLVPGPCEHRLLVMDDQLMPETVRHLATGAKKLSLIRSRDLYGRIDLAELREVLPDLPITVEHARTRTSRFCARYNILHEETHGIAARLVDAFLANSPVAHQNISLNKDSRNALVLELADKLFFRAIRIEGLVKAISDPQFDSVIVSFSDNSDLFRVLSLDPSIINDPRILAGCWSAKISTRLRYAGRMQTELEWSKVFQQGVMHGLTGAAPAFEGNATDNAVRGREDTGSLEPNGNSVIRAFITKADQSPERRPGDRLGMRHNVALVTSESRAYTGSVMEIALHLQKRFNVDVIVTAGGKTFEAKEIAKAAEKMAERTPAALHGLKPVTVNLRPTPPGRAVQAHFNEAFLHAVKPVIAPIWDDVKDDTTLRATFGTTIEVDIAPTVLQVLTGLRQGAALLSSYRYSAVLISPVRAARNATVITAAREAGIPTMTVEPHCLNAAYCRYGAVTTDYAALHSDFFIQEYDRHFGIPADRSFAVGSPRVSRPADYVRAEARQSARGRLGLQPDDPPVIAVPTQPMPKAHIHGVWRMIVRAAKRIGRPVQVLLKSHPEENEGDVENYRAIIAEEGAENICRVMVCDIKDLLMASDLVLTCYSVTALETALLEVNLAIVSQPGAVYPIDYDKIIGVPLCCTEEETYAAMVDTLENGERAATSVVGYKSSNPHLYERDPFTMIADAVDEVIRSGPGNLREYEDLPKHPFVTAPFQEYME